VDASQHIRENPTCGTANFVNGRAMPCLAAWDKVDLRGILDGSVVKGLSLDFWVLKAKVYQNKSK